MAIVKMKKLALIAVSSQRDEILETLSTLGCVEILDPEAYVSDDAAEQTLRRAGGNQPERRMELARLELALKLLDEYAPVKKKLLARRPTISQAEFLSRDELAETLALAEELADAEEQMRRISAEEGRLRSLKESLQPWKPLGVALDFSGTQMTRLILGAVRAQVNLAEVEQSLQSAAPEADVFCVSADQEQQYLELICLRSEEQAALEALRQYGFAIASLGVSGTAAENIAAIDGQLKDLARERQELKEKIAAQRGQRPAVERCIDRERILLRQAEAADRLLNTECTFVCQGWLSAPEEGKLTAALEQYDCAWFLSDPEESEYPDVPVKLQNNWFTKPLNMVTEMYSLPAYSGVDPNPLMAPFFILFYGIMLADMGYGLLMMLASVIVLTAARPKKGMHNFFALMGLCGISTFIMGALTGGFFGDFLPQLAQLINPDTTFTALPALFTPLDDTLMILVGAMVLGFIQIVTGMAISVVRKFKRGEIWDAIWGEITWWVVFAGIGLMVLDIGSINGVPVVLALGCLMIVVGSGWNAKGFGKVTAIFSSLYSNITGYFGDILSYSRLMALMLAGSVIAQVFNTLGAIPGNVPVFILIALVGNALNFALNLLGCYVHDLRLQCLEYFGKFYEDGGRAFEPLDLDTKYVDIVK